MPARRPAVLCVVIALSAPVAMVGTGLAGRPGLAALFLLATPLTSLAAVLVLAFAQGGSREQEVARRELFRQAADRGRDRGAALLAELTSGAGTGPVEAWGLDLRPGETALLDDGAGYCRFHGTPPVRLDGPIDDPTARRRRGEWYEHQGARVVVTDQRIACRVDGAPGERVWVHLDHATLTALHPDLGHHRVVLEHADALPTCLSGPESAPVLLVTLLWALHGTAGLSRPELDVLRP